jgi:hypothetical protein
MRVALLCAPVSRLFQQDLIVSRAPLKDCNMLVIDQYNGTASAPFSKSINKAPTKKRFAPLLHNVILSQL